MKELPFLIAFLLVLAVLLRLDFVYYIIYVIGGLWLFSRWATPRAMRSLRVTRQFSDHAFLGETIPVSLQIANTTRLPLPWLRINESMPLDLATSEQLRRIMSLRSREQTTLTYNLRGKRRGYYPVGPLQLSSGDLFGFAEIQARDEKRQYLTVYPRIIPLGSLGLPSRLPFGTLASNQRIFEDPARLRGVRGYQAGDSLRRINWKASAHQDALLVKQFSSAISLESMVLLNLNSTEYERRRRYSTSEWAIVVAASIASYLVSARQAVGLATNGFDPLTKAAGGDQPSAAMPIPPHPGRPHLMKILELLARTEMWETGEAFSTWAQRTAVPLAWGTTAIAITSDGEEPTCRGLHALVRRGLNVVLLVVEPYGRFGIVRQRARRLGFTAYLVATEADLNRLQLFSTPARQRMTQR